MSGLPKTSGENTVGVCTGEWAGHTDTDDRHCVCWWDDRGPCCQCGEDAGVEPKPWPPMPVSCISCGAPWDPDADPAITTLGVRCTNCWTGGRTSQLGRW